ncbi:MAG: hypothetical protein HY791_35865 [Deltaproteobacteria bacterium]|nr:hypothetical protein [Deltaproteobacteria bacterium]
MREAGVGYVTEPIELVDTTSGFSCGKHSLDDYFARHALKNDALGIGRAYVFHRRLGDDPALPTVLGFYTLSMASAESQQISDVLKTRLPKYPMPVALTSLAPSAAL